MILRKGKQLSPVEVAETYLEISMQYETMNEFLTAKWLLKRLLDLLECHPEVQHSKKSVFARIGQLLLLTSKVQPAITCLESSTKRLNVSIRPKHLGVGYVYNNLRVRYLELDKRQLAAQVFAATKDIMDASIGPHHADAIEECQNFSKAYDEMGSENVWYLDWADRVVDRLSGDQSKKINTDMWSRIEALKNLRKCLENKEMSSEKDAADLAKANRDLAEAYVALSNFWVAEPYCLKALETHQKQFGENSVEVAHDRKLLGILYTGLDNHEKALEQNVLVLRILKNLNLNSDFLRAEIDAANTMIALGRHGDAVSTLKNVIHQTDKDSVARALVVLSIAKALCNQKNFAACNRCLEISLGILDKRERISPMEVAKAYIEISMLYETMNEFEAAISSLKKALALLEKNPQEQHSLGKVSARIGWLLLLTRKVHSAIIYLEGAAKNLEHSLGYEYLGLSYVHNNLGVAYLELDRPQLAVPVFGEAYYNISRHVQYKKTIQACQNLAKAEAQMGSLSLAIESQEYVIDDMENCGVIAEDKLREARRFLKQLRKKLLMAPQMQMIHM